MRNFAAQLSLIAIAAAVGINPMKDDGPARFGQYIARHNKHYKNAEDHTKRYQAWLKVDKELNIITGNPKNTFKVGHNKFSDMDESELDNMFLPPLPFRPKLAEQAFYPDDCECPKGCTECTCNEYGRNKLD